MLAPRSLPPAQKSGGIAATPYAASCAPLRPLRPLREAIFSSSSIQNPKSPRLFPLDQSMQNNHASLARMSSSSNPKFKMTTSLLHDLAEVVSRTGLSVQSLRILAYLSSTGQASCSDLVSDLRINRASLPRYISSLFKSGHLVSTKNCPDGRAVLYSLGEPALNLVSLLSSSALL